jgi:hypothetical protein
MREKKQLMIVSICLYSQKPFLTNQITTNIYDKNCGHVANTNHFLFLQVA